DLIVNVADELEKLGIRDKSESDTLKNFVVYSEYGTIWVVDSGLRAVSKYTVAISESTLKGVKILTSPYSFAKPVAIKNHIKYSPCYYVADHDAGEIVQLNPQGKAEYTFTDIPNVIDLAVHYDTGTLWAVTVSSKEPRLVIYNTFTNSLIKSVKGLNQPTAITINQKRDDVWIADIGDTDRIILLNAEEFLADVSDTLTAANAKFFDNGYLNNPGSIAIRNETEGTLYIADTDDGQIEMLSYDIDLGEYDRFDAPSKPND
ncbi:unnamed protein product, partial [marine sediment metagenome]